MNKRVIKNIILIVLIVGCVVLFYENKTINAATKESKLLEPDKKYSYDLDGDGKKEQVKYTIKEYIVKDVYSEYIDSIKVTLYINQKAIYSKKVSHSYSASYSIVDLNTKDKSLDLFLLATGDSECVNYSAIQRYKNDKIINILNFKYGSYQFGYAKLYRILNKLQTAGDGTFSIIADTPLNWTQIGSYYCHIPFTVKNNKAIHVKTKTYKLVKWSNKYNYVANQNITVYSKADKASEKVTTIKKGESINIKKLKVIGSNLEDSRIGYAYIIDKKGNKGWICFPKERDWENPMFKEVPAWG